MKYSSSDGLYFSKHLEAVQEYDKLTVKEPEYWNKKRLQYFFQKGFHKKADLVGLFFQKRLSVIISV